MCATSPGFGPRRAERSDLSALECVTYERVVTERPLCDTMIRGFSGNPAERLS
ncbi:MAG: hypothetical protein QOD39_5177 [Mycobacterium sp.]|nr:hypothetical protein [Mycobacterium sp.]